MGVKLVMTGLGQSPRIVTILLIHTPLTAHITITPNTVKSSVNILS